MKKILLIGAGKSATHLINYLLEQSQQYGWKLFLADTSLALAQQKLANHSCGQALQLDVTDAGARMAAIREADIVISMLPASLHGLVASDCVLAEKNLLTASYVDAHLRSLAPEVKQKGLLFLCEMGLDPGIDHMSAMEMLDSIKQEGGELLAFRSHCGGLIAPESDNNPWHYKISWNPRNIILAGKAGAHYRENGKDVHLDHAGLFAEVRLVVIPGLGPLAWYPNRDSLGYEGFYGLKDTDSLVRTTLRHPHFIKGWQEIIELGLTDDATLFNNASNSWEQAWSELLTTTGKQTMLDALLQKPAEPDGYHFATLWQQLCQAGIGLPINKERYSAADLLQLAAERAWALQPDDRDMIVMLHEMEYRVANEHKTWTACLVVKGEDATYTAMSKTVGLPLGIACKLILTGQITSTGVCIPVSAEIYQPVLAELAALGIEFLQHKSNKPLPTGSI